MRKHTQESTNSPGATAADVPRCASSMAYSCHVASLTCTAAVLVLNSVTKASLLPHLASMACFRSPDRGAASWRAQIKGLQIIMCACSAHSTALEVLNKCPMEWTSDTLNQKSVWVSIRCREGSCIFMCPELYTLLCIKTVGLCCQLVSCCHCCCCPAVVFDTSPLIMIRQPSQGPGWSRRCHG